MWCNIDDLRIWYEARGEGTPVIFLHGWAMDHRDETLVYEPIFTDRPGYKRIYPNLPGMGRSPARDWIKNQDHYLDLVLRFIARMVGEDRFLLAGTSAGAYLARGIVHRTPTKIDGVLLRVPLMVADDRRRDVAKFRPLIEDKAFFAKLSSADRKAYAQLLVQSPKYLKAARRKHEKQVLPAQKIADTGHLDPIRHDPKRYAFAFDVDTLSQPFGAPTLIVTGRQDVNVGYRDAWRILDNFPRASFVVLDRADHGLPIDHADVFRALVNDWLDRVEEAKRSRD